MCRGGFLANPRSLHGCDLRPLCNHAGLRIHEAHEWESSVYQRYYKHRNIVKDIARTYYNELWILYNIGRVIAEPHTKWEIVSVPVADNFRRGLSGPWPSRALKHRRHAVADVT